MHIPLSQPDITEREIESVVSVLRDPRLSLGPKLQAFEESVAAYTGVPHGVAVSSGTAGMHLCVRALRLGTGDEVIVPSFTFIAAANVIRYEGATPIFVDICPETLNLDPARVKEAITPRTRAIMIVHTFGRPAEMDSLLAIARQHNLKVIEDACEALGAEYEGRRVGSFGDAAVFAFYPNKQITTGEGGMVVTRNAHLAREIRALRNQGRYETDAWHQHSLLGFNYRLSEINCALGVVQMQRLDEILRKRAAIAESYERLLRQSKMLLLPSSQHSVSWFVYVVRLATRIGGSIRDEIMHELASAGIQCGRYFAPIHQQPAYAGWPIAHPLPVTESESLCTLALPFYSNLAQEEIAYVARHLLQAIERHST